MNSIMQGRVFTTKRAAVPDTQHLLDVRLQGNNK